MTFSYSFCKDIDLHVDGRITAEDAERQEHTTREILRRFSNQPGLVLADEVGMGKTFVALATAVSVALADPKRRPVVIMVPPSLKQKWPKDFALFQERCLPPDIAAKLRFGLAERPIEFLKQLDDLPSRRKQILFVTHGAMSRALFDKWVKLALIRHAISGRQGVRELRRNLSRFMPDILHMRSRTAGWDAAVWQDLLTAHPHDWRDVLQDYEITIDDGDAAETKNDLVPKAVLNVLGCLDTQELYETLRDVPRRRSANLQQRIATVRTKVHSVLQELWADAIGAMNLKLPLVVLDEAHHLKNRQTRLASLFHLDDAQKDADTITRGAFGGVFERMLFLTATPFQLGHAELCSVLERFDGIAWSGRRRPELGRSEFRERLDALRESLDAAQLSALRLERAWGTLRPDDLSVGGEVFASSDAWWQQVSDSDALTENAAQVIKAYRQTEFRMRAANAELKSWVIRHLKPRTLSDGNGTGSAVPRRRRYPGHHINGSDNLEADAGLPVEGKALLPFLLAARAVTTAPESRPVFAEGLASSYEAFLHTRKRSDQIVSLTDTDDDEIDSLGYTDSGAWYLDNLESMLRDYDALESGAHPKVSATVMRVADLWSRGEKILVFCHYVATGRVLRQRISEEVNRRILKLGKAKLGCRLQQSRPSCSASPHALTTRRHPCGGPAMPLCSTCLAATMSCLITRRTSSGWCVALSGPRHSWCAISRLGRKSLMPVP